MNGNGVVKKLLGAVALLLISSVAYIFMNAQASIQDMNLRQDTEIRAVKEDVRNLAGEVNKNLRDLTAVVSETNGLLKGIDARVQRVEYQLKIK